MIRSVVVKGRTYCVGLWWQVPPKPADSRKAMLQMAQLRASEFPDEAYNAVVIRRHQYGMGHMEGKLPKRGSCPSLAAALNPRALSFLGVFCLEGTREEGLWWVCGIRQGSVAGEGDTVWSGYDEAHKASLKLLNSMRSCDQRLTYETPQESMDAIGAMLRPDARLGALFPDPALSRKHVLVAAGLVVVGSLIWGVMQHQRQREHEATSRSHEAREAVLASRRAEIEANVETYFSKPWEKGPEPQALIRSCVQDALAVPLVSRGWVVELVDCSATGLSVVWEHQPGASYLVLPDEARLGKDPQKAVAFAPHKVDGSRSPKVLWSAAWTGQVLAQLGQDAGARIDTPWERPEQRTVEGVTIVAPWIKAKLEISHVAVPLLLSGNFAARLAEVPGLLVTHVIFKNDWTIQGEVYARP